MDILKKIYRLLTQPQKHFIAILFFLILIGTALETLSVSLVIPALVAISDSNFFLKYPFLKPIHENLGNPSQNSLIIMGLGLLIIIYLIKTIFLAFLAWRQAKFIFSVQENISQQLFAGYLKKPYTFHLEKNSAQLISTITNETNQFAVAALLSGILLLTEILAVLGISTLLLFIEPLGATIVVISMCLSTYIFYRATKAKTLRWGQARQKHEVLRMQHLQQGLGGVKDVKILGREDDFIAQYSKHNSGTATMSERQNVLQALPRLWLELLSVLGLAALILTMLWQNKQVSAIVPALGVFAAAAFKFMPSINRIINYIQSLRYSLPVTNLLYNELKQLTPTSDKSHSLFSFQEKIDIHDIAYSYPETMNPVLKNININISKGEVIGFIGSSGTGKSTLIDLILGLLPPTQGSIMVDGVNIEANIRGWQNLIGYVPQNIYLTDDSLLRNIAFGLPTEQIDELAVRKAIKAAQLDDLLSNSPQGLETMVGERGVRLSGGQRQRIGIARALYHNPSVLILDEATSALDTTTEEGVMNAVNSLKGKTIIIVTHRLSTLSGCNTIYKLDNGNVVAKGLYKDFNNNSKKEVSHLD